MRCPGWQPDKRSQWRSGPALAGLLIAAVLVSGCWSSSTTPAPDPVPVRLGLGLESLSALAFIAAEHGDFEREGLDVRLERYPSGRLALQALLSNEVDFALAAQTPVVFATPRHPDLRILAVVGSSDNEMKLIARRDRGITRAADLRGKTIAAQPHSSMHFFTHLYLLRHGLRTNEVTLLFRPPDALPALLVRGEVDAIASREPIGSQVREELSTNAVVLQDRGLYVKVYLLLAQVPVLQERPAVAPRLLRALLRAEASAAREPDQARAIVARVLAIPETREARLWHDLDLRVRLSQALLLRLEDEARWASEANSADAGTIPDYFRQIDLEPLESVKPDAVSIIH